MDSNQKKVLDLTENQGQRWEELESYVKWMRCHEKDELRNARLLHILTLLSLIKTDD